MKEEYKNKIQQFLDNQLEGEELDAFYEELKENEQLLEALSVEVVKIHGRLELKKKLSEIEKKVQQEKTNHFPAWFKIAAVFFVLIASLFFIKNIFLGDHDVNTKFTFLDTLETKDKTVVDTKEAEKEQFKKEDTSENIIKEKPGCSTKNNTQQYTAENEKTLSASQLAANYFEPYPKPQYRGNVEDLDDVFLLYEAKKYDTVISLFNQKLKTLNDEETINMVLFYRGVCLFNKALEGDDERLLESAKKSFAANYTDAESMYREESGWYLALVYLSLENKAKATEILKKIVYDQAYNHKEANLLLEKL